MTRKIFYFLLSTLFIKATFDVNYFKPKINVDKMFTVPTVNNPANGSRLRQMFEELNKRSNPFNTNQLRTQPRSMRMRAGQTSPIASVVIPSIQPVLDIIVNGATEIYNQVNALLGTTLDSLQVIIDTSLATAVTPIAQVITTGNNVLQQDIANAFNTASVSISTNFQTITTQENVDASANISQNNAALLQSIQAVLNDVQAQVSQVVSSGLTTSLNQIVADLTAANNSLITQINALLADPNNTQPILPQLVFADATAIANELTQQNNALYTAVVALLNTAWTQIQTLITDSAASGVQTQTVTLEASNDALLLSLNTNVSTAIDQITASIIAVTADEVQQITTIINDLTPSLTSQITGVIQNLETEIEVIINNVTAQQITDTVALITSNNSGVLNAVLLILSS